MKKIVSIALIIALLSFPFVSIAEEEENEAGPVLAYEEDGLRCFDGEEMILGMYTIGEDTYYFNPEDGLAQTGWVEDKYYFDSDYHMVKGWKDINGKTYFFGKLSGKKLTGLYKIGKGKSALVCTFSKKGVLQRKLYASKKAVCLTFDDGPSANTSAILTTLGKYNAKATFFMVGNRCKSYQAACKKVTDKGHQVGCHTFSHPWLTNLNAKGIKSQMTKGNNAIKKYTGKKPNVCRTPGGENTSTIRGNVGLPIILWSVDTRDWEHRDKNKTLKYVKEGAKDGAIILMHDLYKTTADAVPSVCKYLKNKGYQMVTIKEMTLLKGVKLKSGKAYYNFK